MDRANRTHPDVRNRHPLAAKIKAGLRQRRLEAHRKHVALERVSLSAAAAIDFTERIAKVFTRHPCRSLNLNLRNSLAIAVCHCSA